MIHFLLILNLLILPILFWRQIAAFAIVSGILLVHILAILLVVGVFTGVLFAVMGPLAFIVSPTAIALLWLKTRPRPRSIWDTSREQQKRETQRSQKEYLPSRKTSCERFLESFENSLERSSAIDWKALEK